jgi:hypothetical protein
MLAPKLFILCKRVALEAEHRRISVLGRSPLAVKLEIKPPIAELLPDTPAYFEAQIRRDG